MIFPQGEYIGYVLQIGNNKWKKVDENVWDLLPPESSSSTRPIIYSASQPTVETDGSPLIPFVSQWIDSTTDILYHYIQQDSNKFWLNLP